MNENIDKELLLKLFNLLKESTLKETEMANESTDIFEEPIMDSPDPADCAPGEIGNVEHEKHQPGLVAVDVDELLKKDLKPRKNIISPWLPEQGLAMIHAERGLGKTYLALTIGLAVSSGKSLLHWDIEEPKGVLYIDGEMSVYHIRERIKGLAEKNNFSPSKPFKIINPELQSAPELMPNLADKKGQEAVDRCITDEIKLIIVDNISCLVGGSQENDAISWEPIQKWAVNWRAKGKSILFIHHSGKNGKQRGTSKREDVLDTVINLRKIRSENEDGAKFKIVFEKTRGFFGKDADPFMVKLSDGKWQEKISKKEEKEGRDKEIVELKNKGMPQNDIAEKVGCSESVVCRVVKKARENGDLPPK